MHCFSSEAQSSKHYHNKSRHDVAHDSGQVRLIGNVSIIATCRKIAVEQALISISSHKHKIFAFCNMHTFNLAEKDPLFASALSKATVFNDGLGIDVASRI